MTSSAPRSTEPPAAMLPVEDALDRILALCDLLPSESRPVDEAVGQVLATSIVAPFDIPPHDNTAMDGYAVQSASTDGASETNPLRLRVIGELAAGYLADQRVGPGEAMRIMTGAPMPDGADTIVPFEETDEHGLRAPGQEHTKIEDVGILKAAGVGNNIRRRGEDVRQGQQVLEAGAVLRGPEAAVLASLGVSHVEVVRRPTVAILSTGDELLSPGEPPAPGKIYDSNSYGLSALVQQYGGVPRRFGIAQDTIEALTNKINEALESADLVITSAGVSRGDFDVVKEVLARGRRDRLLDREDEARQAVGVRPVYGGGRPAGAAYRPAGQSRLVAARVRAVWPPGDLQADGARTAASSDDSGDCRARHRQHRLAQGLRAGDPGAGPGRALASAAHRPARERCVDFDGARERLCGLPGGPRTGPGRGRV